MTRETATAYLDESEKLHSKDAWIWLLSIPLEEECIRLARSKANVTWPASLGLIWYAFDFDFEPFELAVENTRAQLRVTATDVDAQILRRFRDYRGFDGRQAILRVVHSANLGETVARDEVFGEIVTSGASEEGYEIVIGEPKALELQEPHNYVDPDFCARFRYGGPGCGFNLNWNGAPQTCDKGFDTPNGCRAHGDWATANGYRREWSARFGGFRTVPRVRQ